MCRRLRSALIISLLTQYACATNKEVEITSLLTTVNCPISRQGLTLFTSNDTFKTELFSNKLQPKQLIDGEANTPLEPPTGNWTLVVNLGERPSLGYGINLAQKKGNLQNRKLVIYLNETRPTPNSAQATMMTSPCTILSFEQGDIEKIVVKSNEQEWEMALERKPSTRPNNP